MTFPDVDSLDTYGGELQDYLIAITDPTTDRSATASNKAYASIAAMSHCAWRAYVRLSSHATSPVLNVHDSAWGSLPAVAPTVARSDTGVYTITWNATQEDELGVSHTLNIRAAMANVRGTSLYLVQATPTAANVVTVYLFGSNGSASDGSSTVIDVWVM